MPVSVEEALERIHALEPKRRREFIPIESALGRILADTLIARHALPPFDNSAMDGYAVCYADKGHIVKNTHTLLAGSKTDIVLEAGSTMRIMTGAPVPEGTEAIVPIEEVVQENTGVRLPKSIRPAQHIRRRGEDIAAGDRLLVAGEKLRAHHLTLLASQGITHICVYQRPRVAILASGSELKMHGETIEAHQLYNTNSPTFVARARELGCDVHFVGTAADSLAALLEHIQSALISDLIITSGGVSVGDADYTGEAFAHSGFIPLFEKVNIKPGKPTTVGQIGDTLVLNLPGNPLAAALNFELFGQAIIAVIEGSCTPFHHTITARMKHDLSLRPGRRSLQPGYFDGTFFSVCKKFAPGMVTPLARSNGFIMVDESCDALSAGECVRFFPTRFEWRSALQVELTSPCR